MCALRPSPRLEPECTSSRSLEAFGNDHLLHPRASERERERESTLDDPAAYWRGPRRCCNLVALSSARAVLKRRIKSQTMLSILVHANPNRAIVLHHDRLERDRLSRLSRPQVRSSCSCLRVASILVDRLEDRTVQTAKCETDEIHPPVAPEAVLRLDDGAGSAGRAGRGLGDDRSAKSDGQLTDRLGRNARLIARHTRQHQ